MTAGPLNDDDDRVPLINIFSKRSNGNEIGNGIGNGNGNTSAIGISNKAASQVQVKRKDDANDSDGDDDLPLTERALKLIKKQNAKRKREQRESERLEREQNMLHKKIALGLRTKTKPDAAPKIGSSKKSVSEKTKKVSSEKTKKDPSERRDLTKTSIRSVEASEVSRKQDAVAILWAHSLRDTAC